MTEFASRWLTWEPPDALRERTDETDESPPFTPDALGAGTDKTDETPFVSSVSACSKRIQENPAASKAGEIHPDWGPEITAVVSWFLMTEPPAQSFELRQAVYIAHPANYWAYLRADISAGPSRARGRTGALQDDLRRLHRLFGGD